MTVKPVFVASCSADAMQGRRPLDSRSGPAFGKVGMVGMVASGSPTPLTWWALPACQPTRVRTHDQSNVLLLLLVAERARGRPGGPGTAVVYYVSRKSVLLPMCKNGQSLQWCCLTLDWMCVLPSTETPMRMSPVGPRCSGSHCTACTALHCVASRSS